MKYAQFTFIARYHGTKKTLTCKLTKANKKYECSVKDCHNVIKIGDLHWTDQTYRICMPANHKPNWIMDD